jgi:hypothetical protein
VQHIGAQAREHHSRGKKDPLTASVDPAKYGFFLLSSVNAPPIHRQDSGESGTRFLKSRMLRYA